MALIQTERLRLRPIQPDDVDVLHRIWTDAGVRRYLWDDVVIDRAMAFEVVMESVRLWEERGYGLWVVLDRESEAAIGFVGFRVDGDRDPELLFGFLPEMWGRGVATEAAVAALRYLFRNMNVRAVWAETNVPNTGSVRVLERIGMNRVGEQTTSDGATVVFTLEASRFEATGDPHNQ